MILGFIATKKDIESLEAQAEANDELRQTEDERLANELGEWVVAQLQQIQGNIQLLADTAQKADGQIVEGFNEMMHHVVERLEWFFDEHTHANSDGTPDEKPWDSVTETFGTPYRSQAQQLEDALEEFATILTVEDEQGVVIDPFEVDGDGVFIHAATEEGVLALMGDDDEDDNAFDQEVADNFEGITADGSEFDVDA